MFHFICLKMENLVVRFHFILLIFHVFVFMLVHHTVSSTSTSDLAEDQSSTRYFFYKSMEYGRDCHDVQSLCSVPGISGVHLIKPEGYFAPFEVFCDFSNTSAGWTVIQRRTDGSIDFGNNWTEYLNGFGFPSNEFWLGNDKIAHLTNQKRYELQIEVETAAGASFYVNYNMFRISDDQGNYKLDRLGQYSGNAEDFIQMCSSNMVYSSCVCQATCDYPDRCLKRCNDGEEACICPNGYLLREENKCVLPQECGCFLDGYGVIPNAGKYANSNCSKGCVCTDNLLTCDDYFQCSTNATCQPTGDTHQCKCNDRFEGDGQTCNALLTDCLELYNSGITTDGVYTIHPTGWSGSKFDVYCDMTTDGGGWTVFQRRFNGSVDFYQNWTTYKEGFGEASGEYWLGNDKIYSLTNSGNYQLRVELVDKHSSGALGSSYYALYDLFRINDEEDNYRLVNLGSFNGTTAYDAMVENRDSPFSTFDRSNGDSTYNAAEKHHGAWWYHSTFHNEHGSCFSWTEGDYNNKWCSSSNLNGDYFGERSTNIFWRYLPGNDCKLRRTEMKIRPI